MTSIDDIMPRLKNLEVELDKSVLKNAELLKLTAEQSSQIDELKKKFDGKSTNQTTDDDFTTKTWFWTSDVVRSTFIQYFKEKREHTFWRACPLLPPGGDQTLLFVNSGMVQYKPIFVGKRPQNHPFETMKRAANSQKCIRAGGKHNDLEDVGKDNYHHTYFEMLGNWSFGDYFKAEAIAWAWDLLTNVYGLPGDRMYATYFEGNEALNMPADLEAKELWGKYLKPHQILPGNMKDNFWEMGDTGPCGPCSELHFDRIGGRNARDLVNQDDPNVLEIWNLVFMQFFRHEDRSLTPLPDKHVDTGMGFERLVSVLQNKTSNYDTDVFAPIFQAILDLRIKEWTKNGKKGAEPIPYGGRMGADDVDGTDTAYRVISDHIRTLTFGITDKIQPSNNGRGYVLRRILRRGVRYGKQFLNLPDGFFSALVETVVVAYGAAFPELSATGNMEHVMAIMKDEEDAFLKTWVTGAKLMSTIVKDVKAKGGKVVSGEDAARLYQSAGFPVDLTRLMAEEEGLTVDEQAFEKAQKAHQEASKGDGKSSSGGVKIVLETAETSILEKDKQVGPTDDSLKYGDVSGKIDGLKVKAIFNGTEFVDVATKGNKYGFVLDKTPFYAEQGGQVSDTGAFSNASNGNFAVTHANRFGPYVLHCGEVTEGTFNVEEDVAGQVNAEYRSLILPNHTMTHVLNLALRAVLGKAGQKEVDQKGSLCDSEKLRFDFNCQKPLKQEQLAEVEEICNDQIKKQLEVYCKVVPLASAKSIATLRAVFGETYPDPVRVVSVGQKVETLLSDPTNPEWLNYSVELCGGTHMGNTKESVQFVLVEESGIAKGIRRVKCLTGKLAQEAEATRAAFAQRVKDADALPVENLETEERAMNQELDKIVCSAAAKMQFRTDVKKITKKVVKYKKGLAAKLGKEALAKADVVANEVKESGEKFRVLFFDFAADGKISKKVLTAMTKIHDVPYMIVAVNTAKNNISCFSSVGKSHHEKIDASKWCNALKDKFGGRGGGKPTNSQWSGDLSVGADVVVAICKEFAASSLA